VRDVVWAVAWLVGIVSVLLMVFAHMYGLVLLGGAAYAIAKVARYGEAATKGKCPYCRGTVKAKAIACKKCGRVVRSLPA